jgi:outer membrane protein assembly factor BamA
MTRFLVGALLVGAGALASAQITPVVNVNSRYVVESIQLSGRDEFSLSRALHEEIQNLIGGKFDQTLFDGLTSRIKRELHAKSVSYRISRGDQPEQVKVNFEITRRSVEFDVNVPKFLYSTVQGWTGVVEGVTSSGANTVSFRLISDNDELVERETGIVAKYENRRVGSDRLRLGFQFESYHESWNNSTQSAEEARLNGGAEVPNDSLATYRTRQNFQPMLTIVLARPLTLSIGASFERFQDQFPAARTESADAVVNTLRYHRLLEDSDAQKEVLDAGYSLRAATTLLSSDFAYARHQWDIGYTLTRGKNTVMLSFVGGFISGHAPIFERYVLGNSSTLRGWNKYDLDPLGGTRIAHGSLEYHYHYFQVFYDVGAIWDRGQDVVPHSSAGVGLRKDGFSVAVAFPIKYGRVEPVLIAGMNF